MRAYAVFAKVATDSAACLVDMVGGLVVARSLIQLSLRFNRRVERGFSGPDTEIRAGPDPIAGRYLGRCRDVVVLGSVLSSLQLAKWIGEFPCPRCFCLRLQSVTEARLGVPRWVQELGGADQLSSLVVGALVAKVSRHGTS